MFAGNEKSNKTTTLLMLLFQFPQMHFIPILIASCVVTSDTALVSWNCMLDVDVSVLSAATFESLERLLDDIT